MKKVPILVILKLLRLNIVSFKIVQAGLLFGVSQLNFRFGISFLLKDSTV